MTQQEDGHAREMEPALRKAIADLDEIAVGQQTLIDIHVETTRLLQNMMDVQRQALARLTG